MPFGFQDLNILKMRYFNLMKEENHLEEEDGTDQD